MCPAAGDCQTGSLFFQGMVCLVAICDAYSLKTFQKLLRMVLLPVLLIFIQDDGFLIGFPSAVDPHIALRAGAPPVFYSRNRIFLLKNF